MAEPFTSTLPRSSSEFILGKQHAKAKHGTIAADHSGKSAHFGQEPNESDGSDSDENPYMKRHANSMYLMHDEAVDLFNTSRSDDEQQFRARLNQARKNTPAQKLSAAPSQVMDSDAVVQLGGDVQETQSQQQARKKSVFGQTCAQ